MSHPLLPQLDRLTQFLRTLPQEATQKDVVKALDKASAGILAAIELLEGAKAGSAPEVVELRGLLVRAFESDVKEAKSFLKNWLPKAPSQKKDSSSQEYMQVLAVAVAKVGKADTVLNKLRHHLNRPRFDIRSTDTYELLKQIRKLGEMDLQQKKAAKAHLLAHPQIVARLCAAASIPTTTGKDAKPVNHNTLVGKLMKHGERYAENSGV